MIAAHRPSRPMGMRMPSPRTAIAAVLLVGAVGWLYAGVLPALVRQWANDDDYSHGFFVVPLALFFAWERRAALLSASRRPSHSGLLLLAGSLLCFIAGQFGSELFLTRISMIGVLAGMVLFVLGWQHLKLLAFPLAFLLLMVPLPAILFNQIAFPSRRAACRSCVKVTCSFFPAARSRSRKRAPASDR